MKPFVVNVADLVNRPGARRRELCQGPLSGLANSFTAVAPASTVVVDTLLEWVSDGVLATGTAKASWRSECRRCLAAVGGEVDIHFQELFEEDPQEGESYPLRHDHLDLEPLAREAILLELPATPLCDDACKGLCPQCGTDRNRSLCGCQVEVPDPRWAALDVLKDDRPGPATSL